MKIFLAVLSAIILFSCNSGSSKTGSSSSVKQDATTENKLASPGRGCSAFFWFKKGAEFGYQSTDGNGKIIANTTTRIDDVHQDGAALVADYSTSFGDGKKINSTYRCEGGKMFMNMKSLFESGFSALKQAGVELEVTDGYLSFPWNMSPGDDLEEASFEIKAKQGGKDFMKMKSIIKDRKVEGMQEITTTAGTWNCMKLAETRSTITEMNGKQVSVSDTKSVQWFSPEAGLVKTESFDDKGKLNFRSELVKLK